MKFLPWLIFVAAALLEVAGDAVMRKGMRGKSLVFIIAGAVMLGCYGWVVNVVKWDFSRLLGVYVAVFATVAVFLGRFLFRENVAPTTWLGLAVIIIGGLIIQFGVPTSLEQKPEAGVTTQSAVGTSSETPHPPTADSR